MSLDKIVLLGPIFVEHHPYSYGDKKYEEPWKQAVADEVRKHWLGRPLLERPVRLKLKFYVDIYKDYDLTGMLESTVNAIANVIFPPRRGGHRTPWNHEDKWVYEIEALKKIREEGHGVEILIEHEQ
jgi:Holliday junction resolvase RusA-like endonuclease